MHVWHCCGFASGEHGKHSPSSDLVCLPSTSSSTKRQPRPSPRLLVCRPGSLFLLALPLNTTHTHSVTTVGSSSSPSSAAFMCVTFPLSLPCLQLVTCCWTCSFPSWPSSALNTSCYSYLHTCLNLLKQILSSQRTEMRFYLPLSALPCFLVGLHLNTIETQFKVDQVR